MGFGFLLTGYVISFVLGVAQVYFFQDVVGGVLMLYGLYKLSPHQKNFFRAFCAALGYIVICTVRAVLLLFGKLEGGSMTATILGACVTAVTLVLHFFMIAGMYHLSLAVGLEKEPFRCRRSLSMIVTYYPMYIIASLFTPSLADAGETGAVIGNIITIVLVLFGAFVVLYNIYLIYCCFCSIVTPADARGEMPKSKFEWLNRYREKTNSLLDSAYAPQVKKKEVEEKEPKEPGFLRIKRKKKK